MLGGAWLFITIVLLIAAVIFKQSSLLIIAVLFFLSSGIARLWSKYALQRFDYKRMLSAKRVFFGESITLDMSITNGKFLPLPWVHIEEEIPEEVTVLKGKTAQMHKPARATLSSLLSLNWYHRVTRHYPIQCRQRGSFLFGPVTISSGDPFGFFRSSMTVEEQERLIVYPRILSLDELGIPSRHPFGDLRVKQHLFEDPVQVMTTRDYVAGDPLKRIHWKTSARRQRLQTRVFEYTTTTDMALFLDTRTVADKYYWRTMNPDFLETAVLAAASIANYGIKEGYKVGFYANEYYYYSNRLMCLPASSRTDQLKEILEALAQVKGQPYLAIETLLNREARQLAWETTIVMITAVPTVELIACLKHFRQTGRKIAMVLIGAEAFLPKIEGMSLFQVSEEIYRRELNTLTVGINR